MEAKYFGEYLVGKGLVKQSDLLSSLVEQTEKLPSLLKIIFDHHLLSEQQIFQVLDQQMTKRIEFRQACDDLGFWNSDLSKRVEQEVAQVRIPFGQILVRRGHLDLTTLIKSFDEFLAQRPQASETSSSAAPVTAEAPPKKVSAQIPEFAFRSLDDAALREFFDFFSQPMLEGLLGEVDRLHSSLEENSDWKGRVDAVLAIIHSLKGVAHYVEAPLTKYLLQVIEDSMTDAKRSEDKGRISGYVPGLKGAVQLMISIQKIVESEKSEKKFFEEHQPEIEQVVSVFQG